MKPFAFLAVLIFTAAMRAAEPLNEWPQRCAEWMQSLGLLGGQ